MASGDSPRGQFTERRTPYLHSVIVVIALKQRPSDVFISARPSYGSRHTQMKAYPDCNGDRVKTCPDCNGDGVVDKDTDDERQCPTCGGLGFVPDDDDHEEVIKTSRIALSVTKRRSHTVKSILGVSLLILLMPSAHAATLPGDSAEGKRLHDANC